MLERTPRQTLDPAKFRDPERTAKGEKRASVMLRRLDTLWLNTGSLCNITCAHCYIESSPTNDRLSYLTLDDAVMYFDEIESLGWDVREIGLTGGEPFMNPDCCRIIRTALERGFDVLVLTNAMQPLLRPRVQQDLLSIKEDCAGSLIFRVSLDHFTQEFHEEERGEKTWDKTLKGLQWLSQNGFSIAIAGRTCWGEDEDVERAGYHALFQKLSLNIDPSDPSQLVLFPEMDEEQDVPEITVDCWKILNQDPNAMMCASSRMVVKRKGEALPTVLPCTLLPYDAQFEMGPHLADATGAVKLNHPHCAKFCVLGGASCSG